MESPSKVIAGVMGLAGFVLCAGVGLIMGLPATTTLWRALLGMTVCWIAGRMIGVACEQLLRSFLNRYREANPIPKVTPADLAEAERAAGLADAGDEPLQPARAA